MSNASAVLIGFYLLGTALPVGASSLYDADFDADTPGEPPSLDAGPLPRTGPSAINFGTPLVQESVGTMATQPLEFQHFGGTGTLEQIQFDLGFGRDFYDIDFDLVVVDLISQDHFSVFLDFENMPTGQQLIFFGGGAVNTFQPFPDPDDRSHAFPGAYQIGVPLHVSIHASVVDETWSIYFDEELLHQGALLVPNGDLFMVRFSLSDLASNGRSLVGLDDVLIAPEPSTVLLVVIGLGLLAVSRRR